MDHHAAHPNMHPHRKAHHPHHAKHKHKHPKPDYQKLFDTCKIDPHKLGLVDADATKIIHGKERYKKLVLSVEGQIPWWFVGLVHKMEANLSFHRHLHNGDLLSKRTVQVPAGRPLHGTPPFTWEASAQDAVRYQKLTKVADWSLAHALYLLEGYNGYGYLYHGRNSPYLWSYSNHYTKGLYVSDGKYDPEAVCRQAGSALILKRMVDRGAVVLSG